MDEETRTRLHGTLLALRPSIPEKKGWAGHFCHYKVGISLNKIRDTLIASLEPSGRQILESTIPPLEFDIPKKGSDDDEYPVDTNEARRLFAQLEPYLSPKSGTPMDASTAPPNLAPQGARPTFTHTLPLARSKKVFIVHGHDEAKKWELKNFLADLGLEPTILHEQDDLGKTIIEKFEHYAPQCSFAFVLLTPDDPSLGTDPQENAWRARQNVIMELGWFMAKLGRDRVVILHRGRVDIPSDILGVLYLPFQTAVTEVGERIRQRLKGAGLIE